MLWSSSPGPGCNMHSIVQIIICWAWNVHLNRVYTDVPGLNWARRGRWPPTLSLALLEVSFSTKCYSLWELLSFSLTWHNIAMYRSWLHLENFFVTHWCCKGKTDQLSCIENCSSMFTSLSLTLFKCCLSTVIWSNCNIKLLIGAALISSTSQLTDKSWQLMAGFCFCAQLSASPQPSPLLPTKLHQWNTSVRV